MTEVEKGARRAHRAERTGRDDVHTPDDLGGRKGARQLGHLFGSQDDGFALTNLFVDLFVTLLHGEILVRSAKYAEIATFQNPRRAAAGSRQSKRDDLIRRPSLSLRESYGSDRAADQEDRGDRQNGV